MPDKRMTEDDVVAELRDGMTIGIGGWGSRRKPMSMVRAIARSSLRMPAARRIITVLAAKVKPDRMAKASARARWDPAGADTWPSPASSTHEAPATAMQDRKSTRLNSSH